MLHAPRSIASHFIPAHHWDAEPAAIATQLSNHDPQLYSSPRSALDMESTPNRHCRHLNRRNRARRHETSTPPQNSSTTAHLHPIHRRNGTPRRISRDPTSPEVLSFDGEVMWAVFLVAVRHGRWSRCSAMAPYLAPITFSERWLYVTLTYMPRLLSIFAWGGAGCRERRHYGHRELEEPCAHGQLPRQASRPLPAHPKRL